MQIFATDLDRDAIDKARQGVFPPNIAADVSPERLSRFFAKDEQGYRVRKEIREMVIFAPQNLIMDPPFTKLDLLSCRNLLIYLEPTLQKKLMSLFHYALNPGGFLFLGTSESTDEFPHLFSPVNRRWKLFQRASNDGGVRPSFVVPVLPWVREESAPVAAAADKPMSLQDLVARMLLEQAPAGVVLNPDGDILYVHGRTGKYLELVSGEGVSSNILRLAREGLRAPLGPEKHTRDVGQDFGVGVAGRGTEFLPLGVRAE